LAGAVHDTTLRPFSAAVADTPVGGCDTPTGTIAEDPVDADPAPDTFVAMTLNVYETPPVRPFTVQFVADVVVHMNPPGEEVTV